MSFDINKPYRTRDGRSVHKLRRLHAPMPTGEIFAGQVGEYTLTWQPDGRFDIEEPDADPRDLVNISEKRTVKMHFNALSDGSVYARTGRSRSLTGATIATFYREITYEVGEGLA